MTDTITIEGAINMRPLLICLRVKENVKPSITEKLILKKNPGLFGCIWFCSQCGIPMFGKDNVQVDHIIPLAGLGINRTINTVAICPRCNREKVISAENML